MRPFTPVQSAKVHVVAPGGFNDAQEIGDRLKSGQPVIVNLQAADRELSRPDDRLLQRRHLRLGGSMDKVADQVFLLTPSNVEVSAEEKRRLQERGSTGPSCPESPSAASLNVYLSCLSHRPAVFSWIPVSGSSPNSVRSVVYSVTSSVLGTGSPSHAEDRLLSTFLFLVVFIVIEVVQSAVRPDRQTFLTDL